MINLRFNHVKRIQNLYKERFGLNEIYIMYKGIIPAKQLRAIVRNVKRLERI
jgi:hypothetical protein